MAYTKSIYLIRLGSSFAQGPVYHDGTKVYWDKSFSATQRGGAYSSTGSLANPLSSTNTRPYTFLGDDAGAVMTGDIRQLLSRVLVTVDQSSGVTLNAMRGQVKLNNTVDITHANTVIGGVQGYLEMAGTSARTLTGHVAAVRAAIEEGASGTTTIAASSYYAGLEVTLNSTRTYTETGQMAGIIVNISGGTSVWPVGMLVADGSCTTAIEIGNCTTGIDFNGTYTGNCIDFTNAVIDYTGSNGPAYLRAGTYADPVTNADEDQSGFIRFYGETTADGSSYDRGIFMCLKTQGAKGIFPIAGLAEGKDGCTAKKIQAAQFISHLNHTGATLSALGGDSTAGMYGAWLKITANEGATTASGSRAAPLWVDNQLYGNNINAGMEEYGIFATTGGSKPKAFIGFETSSVGWANLLYFDETAYDQDPVASATISGGTQDKYLKVDINGTAYGLALYQI